jgi:hypothetical protein
MNSRRSFFGRALAAVAALFGARQVRARVEDLTPRRRTDLCYAGLNDPERRAQAVQRIEEFLQAQAREFNLVVPLPVRSTEFVVQSRSACDPADAPLAVVLGVPVFHGDFGAPYHDLRKVLARRLHYMWVQERSASQSEEPVVGTPGRRYAVVTGASVFGLHQDSGVPLLGPLALGVASGPALYTLVADHERYGRPGCWPRDRPVGVAAELQIGTYEELVARYADGLRRAIASWDESGRICPSVPESHDAALREAGITEFRVLPPAPPERVAYAENIRKTWTETGCDPRLPAA